MRQDAKTGFEHIVVAASKVYKMDIIACPYVKYCKNEGCPKLAHIFCNNNVYTYGNLKRIRFTRIETLAAGGEKCDFCFWKMKEIGPYATNEQGRKIYFR